MNPRQLLGLAGGFLLVYIVITLTNRPVVTPREPAGAGPDAAAASPAADQAGRVRGFTLLPPPGAPVDDASSLAALRAIAGTGARWVALRPVLTQATGTSPEVPADATPPEELARWRKVLQEAHAAGLAVMLRPLVAAADGTRREAIAPPAPTAWLASWERALQPWLTLAQAERVELFCLGSNMTRLQAEAGWRDLATRARTQYTGRLTYASSVEEAAYRQVSWWDAVDYVGLDAFFPLSRTAEPDGEALRLGWQGVVDELTAWRGQAPDRPVLFTAVGVPSVVGGAIAPALPDATAPRDEGLPARAAEALFATVWQQPWFAGMFWHTWAGGGRAHEAFRTADTPTAAALQAGYGAP
ncbi:MAG: hypothetical protein VKS61_14105 [Candidatus Sericytochromatia bacterium]|nr:hypothetical protein [Candidatus Sericytochromatia bacterium]